MCARFLPSTVSFPFPLLFQHIFGVIGHSGHGWQWPFRQLKKPCLGGMYNMIYISSRTMNRRATSFLFFHERILFMYNCFNGKSARISWRPLIIFCFQECSCISTFLYTKIYMRFWQNFPDPKTSFSGVFDRQFGRNEHFPANLFGWK